MADVARQAGAAALRHFRTDLTITTKDDGSPVSIADFDAERTARHWINQYFPGDAIVGEEEGVVEAPNATHRWVIDPIDGTKSFIRGVPLWGTMVGVMSGDTVLAGAVCFPALDELIVAADSAGCWHNGSRCSVSDVSDITQATILTTDDRFRGSAERQRKWTALATRAALARTWGDCYGYLLVATGRAEVMVDNRLSIWDYAPLVPILREAGGVITDWRGNVAFGGDAIATNRALSDDVRRMLVEPPVTQPSP